MHLALVLQEIPKVGLVMEAVRVTRWLKNIGDAVTLGEPLVEVETEKSVVEIEATAAGRLTEILVQIGQEANVGDPIARIETGKAEPTAIDAPRARTAEVPRPSRSKPAALESGDAERIRSSPVARRLAAEHSLDLTRVTGSGPGGRVQLEDVKRALGSQPGSTSFTAASAAPSLPPMRRALARAMTLSNATVPQFIVE